MRRRAIEARLLFLSANASDRSPLAVDREYNRVKAALQAIGVWPTWRVAVEHEPAAEWAQVPEQLLAHAPSIVHFAGHGYPDGSLELSSPNGAGQRIHPTGLGELFKAYRRQVRLVVLNACYSDALAAALTAHVDVVVGMTRAITDEAAILFAPMFYQQLAGGQSVQAAFDVARAAVLGQFPEPGALIDPARDAEAPSVRDIESSPSLPGGTGMHLRVREGVDAAWMTFAPARAREPGRLAAAIAGGAALVAAGYAGVAWLRGPIDPLDLEMVHVPGGEGVTPFWIAKTELTQAAWQATTGGNPSEPQFGIGPRYPVNRVTWDEAITTANALSRKRGWSPCYARAGDTWQRASCTGYRLVTDIEWRHLATLRAPAAAPCTAGNLADQALLARRPKLVALLRQAVPDFAVVACDDHHDGLAAVASFASDALGIYDLDGNVAEWIWNATPSRPATPAVRGSWFLGPGANEVLPPSDALAVDRRDPTIGVRYARDAP